jgi:hypothetical protein
MNPWLTPFCRLPITLYDLFLLVLTIYKCIEAAPRSWRRIPLIWILIRDGSWAFALVFGQYPMFPRPYLTLHVCKQAISLSTESYCLSSTIQLHPPHWCMSPYSSYFICSHLLSPSDGNLPCAPSQHATLYFTSTTKLQFRPLILMHVQTPVLAGLGSTAGIETLSPLCQRGLLSQCSCLEQSSRRARRQARGTEEIRKSMRDV